MTTPMFEQWNACKAKSKDAVLLFRLGDFYEAFYEDAAILSRELDVTLTRRQEVPMSGIPAHAAEKYIEKLVGKGYLVAVAEQVEDPSQTKGIVKREVTRTISPATVFSSSLLSEKKNNYFASVCQVNKTFGIALIDTTTGEFRTIECEGIEQCTEELIRLCPSEILLAKSLNLPFPYRPTVKEGWHFDHRTAVERLSRHLGVAHLDGFGLKGMVAAINAAGALLAHLIDTLGLCLSHVKRIELIQSGMTLRVDPTTARHLELFDAFLIYLDQTHTPMGGRLLRRWLERPLCDKELIEKRQEGVGALRPAYFELVSHLSQIRDLERILSRILNKQNTPRDLYPLAESLRAAWALREILPSTHLLDQLKEEVADLTSLSEKIERAIEERAPLRASDGNVIKKGYNSELDRLRALKENGQEWLARYQTQLQNELGIKTLKVGYSRSFGYFIEVSRGASDKMPPSFHKRQTLVNAERFISGELKQFEEEILSAEEKITALETSLYNALLDEIVALQGEIFTLAKAVASIDALCAFAFYARRTDYTCPSISDEGAIAIRAGRHPLLEGHLRESFIPNDTYLDRSSSQLLLITGPNMAGKSTYIRQVALITLLAHLGAYVPAEKAQITLVDQLFTRIGANDDLARGQSTFMVEMSETANILNNATDKSLVILDEIGRGTSTYDGIAIAYSVAEYLLNEAGKKAKTLFATHYFELTALEKEHPSVENWTVSVSEEGEEIRFLHRIVRGCANRSYGIHVAKLAGIPDPVIRRATERLKTLEKIKEGKKPIEEAAQLSLFV